MKPDKGEVQVATDGEIVLLCESCAGNRTASPIIAREEVDRPARGEIDALPGL